MNLWHVRRRVDMLTMSRCGIFHLFDHGHFFFRIGVFVTWLSLGCPVLESHVLLLYDVDLWWQGLEWGRWGRVTAHRDQMNHNNCQSVVSLLNREIHNYMILTLKLVSRYHTYPPWQMIKLQHCFVVSQMQCKSALAIPMNTQFDFDYTLFSLLFWWLYDCYNGWGNLSKHGPICT